MKVSVLGDIHGETQTVFELLNQDKTVIQLGDFGFAKAYERILLHPKVDNLMVIGGNHDEYPVLVCMPFYLGNFGLIPGTSSTFFVRGAMSIDKQKRTQNIDWWKEEELSFQEANEMLDAYERFKPGIVITHDCPTEIKNHYCCGSFTSKMLSECISIHKPNLWVYGHHHVPTFEYYKGTLYRCLGIDEVLEVELA